MSDCKECEKVNIIKEDIRELKQENREIRDDINEIKRENVETRVYYKMILEKIDESNNRLKMFEKNLNKIRDEGQQGWNVVGSMSQNMLKTITTVTLGGGMAAGTVAIVLKAFGVF